MRFDQVTYEASYGTSKQLPPSTQPEICFSGRSNVGKSSLLNKILNRKQLARVSSQPGKTITINFFQGDGVKLVDLPGYGYAKASNAEKDRWGKMINYYFTSGRNIPLVVQLVDMRHKPSKDDLQMLQFLMETNTAFIVALTKSDKLNKTQYREALAERSSEIAPYGALAIIPFSSKTGEGAETVRQFIADAVL
ncbi:MAG: YihA family ribosome biogenesis GTP-binding protein [Clostridia bacterium]|nr:YihA family ribosome biogenesis GTP-binding protein [Clostridia bacterium]MBP5459694.1 YihA family ribosome biogenesis GTP-binding protein [Clostridia bacterium]